MCPILKYIIIEGRFFVFEVVSGQKSVLSGYSPMSVPPPKRGKFIFDRTELFVYNFFSMADTALAAIYIEFDDNNRNTTGTMHTQD